MKTLFILLLLILIAGISEATVTINATLTNSSATSWNCSINMNSSASENSTTYIYFSTENPHTTLYSNSSNSGGCFVNATRYLSSIQTITTTPCMIIQCIGGYLDCTNDSGGSTSIATKNITGTNCTTTSTTSTTSPTPSTYPQMITPSELYPVWGLNDSENMTGLGNTSGFNTILGLSKPNFFRLASLIIITLTTIALSTVNPRFGILMGVVTADILILVIKWIDATMGLFMLINILAILIFITGGRK